MSQDILGKYKDQAEQQAKQKPVETDQPDKGPYKAFGLNQAKDRQLKIDIRDGRGGGMLLSYSYLTRVIYTTGKSLTLCFTDCIITVNGSRLEKLREFLQDEKVRYIQVFNENRFYQPKDEEPVINKIKLIELGKKSPAGKKTKEKTD